MWRRRRTESPVENEREPERVGAGGRRTGPNGTRRFWKRRGRAVSGRRVTAVRAGQAYRGHSVWLVVSGRGDRKPHGVWPRLGRALRGVQSIIPPRRDVFVRRPGPLSRSVRFYFERAFHTPVPVTARRRVDTATPKRLPPTARPVREKKFAFRKTVRLYRNSTDRPVHYTGVSYGWP